MLAFASLFYCDTFRCHTPKSWRNWCWIEQIQVRVPLFQRTGCSNGLVVWNSTFDVMRHVCATDPVMQKIENRAIWSIHRQKCPLDVRPLRWCKVGYICVGVLKPCVKNKPNVYEHIRARGQGRTAISLVSREFHHWRSVSLEKGEYRSKERRQSIILHCTPRTLVQQQRLRHQCQKSRLSFSSFLETIPQVPCSHLGRNGL